MFRLPVPVVVDRPETVAVSLSAVVTVLLPLSVIVSAPVKPAPKLTVSLPEPNSTAVAAVVLFRVSAKLPVKSPALTVDKSAASAPTVAVRLSLPVIFIVVSDVSDEISETVLASANVKA